MDDLIDRLQALFRYVFGDDEILLTRETVANDIDGWDSLMHLNLVIAVEHQFHIKFAIAEISKLKDEGKNLGDFVEILARRMDLRR